MYSILSLFLTIYWQGATGEIELVEGQKFKLSLKKEDFEQGDSNMVYVDYANLAKTVKKSSKIYMDDGLIGLRVTEVGDDYVMTVVENSGKLGSKKGVNLPEAVVDLPAVSEKDKADIMFGLENGVSNRSHLSAFSALQLLNRCISFT
jgi:pyruvate kinase